MPVEPARYIDVLIVGAGISGIDAAYHLQTRCPAKTFRILEGRDRLGGTWDLFRYPGVRADSDMYTLGFPFRPWTGANAIVDGRSILAYLGETAATFGIDRKIDYGMHVERARWKSNVARWTVDVRDTSGRLTQLSTSFLFLCCGYYDYDHGITPELPGHERCRARIVHPQHWPSDLDHTGKRIVVIGSGATAVSLVPELAKRAAHVTMLQRSPTYFISIPQRDRLANWTRDLLSARPAHTITRWRNILLSTGFYAYCRRFPTHARRMLVDRVRRALPEGTDIAGHFTPSYQPWDQRLCLIPDGDLFETIRRGRASVVTDHFETFTETGVALRSGNVLDADLIVTATGLRLKNFGGIELEVDGVRIDVAKSMLYRDMMIADVPNLAFADGYYTASWTLKCDLTSRYVCRLLDHMQRKGFAHCRPRRDPSVEERPLIDLAAGYVQRASDELPRQGATGPWRAHQNHLVDLLAIQSDRFRAPALEFVR